MDTLTAKQLQSRWKQIQQLLRPIAKVEAGPACQCKPSTYECLLGTYDGSTPTTSYRDWRFATKLPGYSACYFEIWTADHTNGQWRLSRAYLNIYKQENPGEEQEFLCLHCDPCVQDHEPHAEYKKGPHIHASAAEESLRHAHIALHCGQLDVVLSSIESLTAAFKNAILMISREVLDSSRARS